MCAVLGVNKRKQLRDKLIVHGHFVVAVSEAVAAKNTKAEIVHESAKEVNQRVGAN
jgi:hypothetical protein